jgi:serine/threonine-protein kinase
VPVPSLIGKTLKEAKERGVNGSFKVVEGGSEPCDNAKKNQVTRQDPESGQEIEKDETVTVTMCTGAVKITVPDVKGLTLDEARSELEAKGFEVETQRVVSEREPGRVADQDPQPGAKKPKNTTITLSIAQAEQKISVPDVIGQDFEAASKQLRDQNLQVNKQEQEVDDPTQVGKVTAMDPGANTQVKKNSTITLTVGKAAAQTPIPSVVGQKVKDAKQILQQAGFNNIQFADGSSQDDNARVATQDPAAPTPSDPKTTTVTLTTLGGGDGGDDGGGIFGGPFGGDG